jgi:gas vesicle protein
MRSVKLLAGILTGVAVGAVIGVLFAPEKGSDTRKGISNQGNLYTDELNGKFNEFINGISRRFDVVKKEAMRLTENGKSKLAEVEVDMKDKANS